MHVIICNFCWMLYAKITVKNPPHKRVPALNLFSCMYVPEQDDKMLAACHHAQKITCHTCATWSHSTTAWLSLWIHSLSSHKIWDKAICGTNVLSSPHMSSNRWINYSRICYYEIWIILLKSPGHLAETLDVFMDRGQKSLFITYDWLSLNRLFYPFWWILGLGM